jgi:hypothetical protein
MDEEEATVRRTRGWRRGAETAAAWMRRRWWRGGVEDEGPAVDEEEAAAQYGDSGGGADKEATVARLYGGRVAGGADKEVAARTRRRWQRGERGGGGAWMRADAYWKIRQPGCVCLIARQHLENVIPSRQYMVVFPQARDISTRQQKLCTGFFL